MLAAVGLLESLVLAAFAIGLFLGGTVIALVVRWARSEHRDAARREKERRSHAESRDRTR